MYAELHCHSAFSLLDGASLPETLVAQAHALGYSALALTDHDELGGAVRFATAAEDAGIGGIIGAELTVEVSDRVLGPCIDTSRTTHLVLLAETREGYANLSWLITRARMDRPRGHPAISFDLLAQHTAGLYALTGCPRGWVPQLARAGRYRDARRALGVLSDLFPDRLAVEVWDHALPEEQRLTARLLPLAQSLGVPWVVTNNVHYATADTHRVHDVLTALRHGCTLDDIGTHRRPNTEWRLKTLQELDARWHHMPDGLAQSLRIAERCAFRMQQLRPSLPVFPLPPGVSADAYLAQLVQQGANERWGPPDTTRRTATHDQQLAHELALIGKLGLAGYFLIVWDIVRFARREGILCQGRGSAANSAVCYCLGITAVDPVRMELLFERFLSEERQEAPDIDIDFAHRDRERVLQYVYERYGRDHAAMVCEQITYRKRSSVRDLARVLGLGVQHERSAPELDTTDPRVALLHQLMGDVKDLPRHRSIHVGGFVLTREPLGTVVPIEPASMPGRTVIQWEKDDLDPVGLVKIDLLGLGILTVVQDCLASIRRTRGVDIDLAQLDMTDQAVYDQLCAADTIGVFQVESRAQMNTLPRLKPRCFYDLVVEVALIRPGPIQGEMVHPYLRRRAGTEPVSYPHPAVEHALRRTLGIPLFQEQGMQVAIAAAGFSPGQADVLRRAMGHKRSRERMAAICQELIDGMQRNGIPQETAQRIYNQINAFADYGFPESHAASFALIVYATAYLRHYYGAEYLCAMLNAQPMGFYSPGTLVEDAKRHGVVVRPIDITCSSWDHTLEMPNDRDGSHGDPNHSGPNHSDPNHGVPAVRLGFRLIRGLGHRAQQQLEQALQQGRFRDLHDFAARVPLDRTALRHLAEAGVFDAWFPDAPPAQRRREALWALLAAARGTAGPLVPPRMQPPPRVITAHTPVELTEADYRITGLSLAGHPMRHLRAVLAPNGIRTAHDLLRNGRDEERIGVAGLVICRQRPPTAKGFMFLTLEDETGMINVIVTPQRFEKDADTYSTAALVLIRGVLQVEGHVVNVRARTVRVLHAHSGEAYVKGHNFH